MFRIVGIVPGCIVNYQDREGKIGEAKVILVKDRFFAVLKNTEGSVIFKRIDKCTLKNPVVNNKVYTLRGEPCGN